MNRTARLPKIDDPMDCPMIRIDPGKEHLSKPAKRGE